MPKIEIDLADLGLPVGLDHEGEPYGSKSLTDLIVDAAVRQLVGDERDLRSQIKEKVDQAITKRIKEQVEGLVSEAFDAPIQRTTPWGERKGTPTTVRELIRESIEAYVQAPGSTDRYSSNNPKNLRELIDDSTRQLLEKDFREYLKQVKEGIKVSVHKKALDAAIAELQK